MQSLQAPGLADQRHLFAKTKLSLRTWFLAIYLLTQNKNGISALSLRRRLGVSYNRA